MITQTTIASKNGYFISCDSPQCDHYKLYFFDKFADMRKEAQKQGWLFRLKENEWEHLCEECKEKQ